MDINKVKVKKIGKIIIIIVAIIGLSIGGYYAFQYFARTNIDRAENGDLSTAPRESYIVTNLEIPWSMVFLPEPDGRILVTERPGNILLVEPENEYQKSMLLTIEEVEHVGEGGLLGMTLHPEFGSDPTKKFVYVYYTFISDDDLGDKHNRVVRYWFNQTTNVFSNPEIILNWIPGYQVHDGGRIKFGPDKMLYITTGDAAETSNSQDLNSLAGKILRLHPNGSIPDDNPYENSPVYSWGHRNPQGITWDEQGRLWSTEHGSSAYDELNLIEPGNNYGWPDIRADETKEGMETPVLYSAFTNTWAPSGMVYDEGKIYWAGLRGSALYVANGISSYPESELTMETYFKDEFGRLRDVIKGPDGFLYILTNNRDGRGVPTGLDDMIIRVNPTKL